MVCLLITFFISFIATTFIIRTQSFHGQFSSDTDLLGPQKFHKKIVPRIGGVAVALGITGASIYQYLYSANPEAAILLICSAPAFFIGLLEDLTKKVRVRTRFMVTALGALFSSTLMSAQIIRLDIPGIDFLLLYTPIAIAFTVFAISGVANAYNIIDGFNGLSGMVGIITLLSLGYIGIKVNDPLIISCSFAMVAAILGFFIWNYPRGFIFLGDGGAYLIGFWIATLSVLIVYRNNAISPWFALLINAYPIWETIFTIYRRIFHQEKSAGHPDGLHFHSLLFRRILNKSQINNDNDWLSANAKTSPYLWILSSLAVIPAVLFWYSTPILIALSILFALSYSWLYKCIVCFKSPKWLRFD